MCAQPLIHNQELSVLYGGAHSQLWGQLFLYVPHILPANITRDMTYLQLSVLREKLDLFAVRLICRVKEGLYAKRNRLFTLLK